jgi:hypothetical protein
MKKRALRYLTCAIGYSNAVFFGVLSKYGIRLPKCIRAATVESGI